MNYRIAILAGICVATLGLAACSSDPGDPVSEPSVEVAPAPEATQGEAASDGSTIKACLDMAGPFAEASEKMAALANEANEANDPQSVVDGYSALAKALGAIAESAADAEMKAAASTAQADMTAVRDGLQKVYVEGDVSSIGELTTATAAMQTSYQALLAFCSV